MQFLDNIESYNANIAVITEDGRYVSYLELSQLADAFAQHIDERCLVFILASNCLESIAAYVGCLRNNIVPMLLSDELHQAQLDNLLKQYQPKYVYAANEQGKYQLNKTTYTTNYTLYPELALLMTTSGSTGSQKCVRLSYKNLTSNTRVIAQYLNIDSKDRPITTLPISYSYGLSIINSHLYQGACILLTKASLMEKSFWQMLKAHHATTFGGVPFTYEILKKLRFAKMDLPALNYLTQAGGKLDPELCKAFNELCTQKGMRFIVMYGQTEACARMSYLPWRQANAKAGSIGIAIPEGKFYLSEEKEGVGELIYEGENVALGYATSFSDLAKEDEFKGVLHTGDIATHDADGFYKIIGRKNRFLKLFGNRVNLLEVEDLLKQAGHDAVCAGSDDNLIVYLSQKEGLAEIRSFVANSIHINQKAIQVKHIEAIPRNAAGKVLYHELEV